MNGSSKFLLWVPLISVLLMIIWGLVSWFGIGVTSAGQLGDSLAPITAVLTAFTLGAALLSMEIQRQDFKARLERMESEKKKEEEKRKWETFISRLEHLDLQHHVTSVNCPWCDMLEKIKSEKSE